MQTQRDIQTQREKEAQRQGVAGRDIQSKEGESRAGLSTSALALTLNLSARTAWCSPGKEDRIIRTAHSSKLA